MPDYHRAGAPGASFFFTVATNFRRPILRGPAIELLRQAFRRELQHHPFGIDAIVVLPDHVHAIWTLPPTDGNFSKRWSAIKGEFTRLFLAAGGCEAGRSTSRIRRSERSVWQRRFWEHVIRDDDDYGRHMDYIHYNPVKHAHVRCPHAWAHSSFSKWVRAGAYAPDWMCVCGGRPVQPPKFGALDEQAGE